MSHLLGEKSVDVLLYLAANKAEMASDSPTFSFAAIQERWDALCAKWGEKVVYAKLLEFERRGYVDYGVSLRSCWITEKGLAKLAEFAHAPEIRR